ncbi:MAG: YitT family protein [Christensenellales bacterium]
MNKAIREHGMIVAGTAIAALSFSAFLVPNRIAPGGVSGLSTIIHYMTGWSVGMVALVVNVLLFAIALGSMQRQFTIRSLYATVLFSFIVDFVPVYVPTHEPFLACVYGGILMGLGIGLVFRGGASTGGTDMVAKMLHRRFKYIGVSWILFILDFAVVVLAGIIFNAELALYALASVFITAKMVDLVTDGWNFATAFYIISSRPEAIGRRIADELQRGVTALHATGVYSGQKKDVLFCVLEGRHQILALKRIVKDEDRQAFVITSSVKEVMGEGFRELE